MTYRVRLAHRRDRGRVGEIFVEAGSRREARRLAVRAAGREWAAGRAYTDDGSCRRSAFRPLRTFAIAVVGFAMGLASASLAEAQWQPIGRTPWGGTIWQQCPQGQCVPYVHPRGRTVPQPHNPPPADHPANEALPTEGQRPQAEWISRDEFDRSLRSVGEVLETSRQEQREQGERLQVRMTSLEGRWTEWAGGLSDWISRVNTEADGWEQELARFEADLGTATGQIAAVSARLEALEAGVDATATAAGDQVSAVSARLEALEEALQADVDATATAAGDQVAAVSARLEALEADVDAGACRCVADGESISHHPSPINHQRTHSPSAAAETDEAGATGTDAPADEVSDDRPQADRPRPSLISRLWAMLLGGAPLVLTAWELAGIAGTLGAGGVGAYVGRRLLRRAGASVWERLWAAPDAEAGAPPPGPVLDDLPEQQRDYAKAWADTINAEGGDVATRAAELSHYLRVLDEVRAGSLRLPGMDVPQQSKLVANIDRWVFRNFRAYHATRGLKPREDNVYHVAFQAYLYEQAVRRMKAGQFGGDFDCERAAEAISDRVDLYYSEAFREESDAQ